MQTKRGPGRPKSDNTKVSVSLRLDRDVLDYWRSTGKGWQTRINAYLRDYITEK